ncbi:MAG: hypothetical protein KAW41_06995 [Candidatus Diapherotrites archaeon]|nr:hypothetical protein [Candidatus Diapherotrites archaeon]
MFLDRGGGTPTPASAFCPVCGCRMRGPWAVHTCSECGMRLCALCAKSLGGFLGFGGKEVCPYCYEYLTRQ